MTTKVLTNGAVYDMEKKRIVSGATLTSDTARDMVRKREEKRMRLYAVSIHALNEECDSFSLF